MTGWTSHSMMILTNISLERKIRYTENMQKNMMKTDVKETDSSYEVDIDLPGFKKDEINAKLETDILPFPLPKALTKMRKIKKANTSARSVMPVL